MKNNKAGLELSQDQTRDQNFVEGVDFYFDGGLMVLTRDYLLKRGYCCGNGCRHCPYEPTTSDTPLQ